MMVLLAVLLMSVSMFLVQRDDTKTIIIAFPNGIEIEAEVADTPEKLLFGMAFQDALPRNSGMIYIFESTGPHRVTTKEYRFPIDMIGWTKADALCPSPRMFRPADWRPARGMAPRLHPCGT